MRHVSKFSHDDGGSALIEAAIAIPVALTLLVGIVDFGLAYVALATAQKSTQDAVRYLTTLPPGAICGWGLDRARNLALYGSIDNTGTPLVRNWTASQITLATPSCPASTASTIRIKADVPYNPMMWTAVGLPSSITMKVDYEARWIGG